MSLLFRENHDNVVDVMATGKLTDEDYKSFAPRMEEFFRQHGKIRLFFEFHDFHGWEAGAMWEDFKFGNRHKDDFERIAVVGEKDWQEFLGKLCRYFTSAEVKYFDHTQSDAARSWLELEQHAAV